jgi:hypothetical protein
LIDKERMIERMRAKGRAAGTLHLGPNVGWKDQCACVGDPLDLLQHNRLRSVPATEIPLKNCPINIPVAVAMTPISNNAPSDNPSLLTSQRGSSSVACSLLIGSSCCLRIPMRNVRSTRSSSGISWGSSYTTNKTMNKEISKTYTRSYYSIITISTNYIIVIAINIFIFHAVYAWTKGAS